MLRSVAFLSALLVLSATACSEHQSRQLAPPVSNAEPSLDAPAEPMQEEVRAPLGDHYVTAVASMRRKASSERKVPSDSDPKKRVTNWLATLHAGEQVEVLYIDGDWARIRASDDTEGFVQTKYLLSATESELLTVLEGVKVFRRPDLLTLNASRQVEPASLLFKLDTKEQFTKVKNGFREDWVLSEKTVMSSRPPSCSKKRDG